MSTSPIIERAARVIDPDSWRVRDTGTFPPEHPAAQAVVRWSVQTAQRLHEQGLLAEAATIEAVREVVGDCTSFVRAWTCRSDGSGKRLDSPYISDGYCLRCRVIATIEADSGA